MIRKSVLGWSLFLLAAPGLADKTLDDRMMHAASILQEIRGSLDEEPPDILQNAYAVAVFPEFVNVGLVGGVKHGRGVLAQRMDSGDWSKPAFVRLTSGSFGLQFGISMSQLLLVFKDPKAVEAISGGQFAIGADAGYAAGELGGSAGAGTDNKLENQVVAMARSKGLFAGVALEGGVLRVEKNANVEFYNDAIGLDGRTLLQDTEVETPAVAQHFQIVLRESVPPLATGEVSGSEQQSAEGLEAGSTRGSALPVDTVAWKSGTKRNPTAAAKASPTSDVSEAANNPALQEEPTEGIWVTLNDEKRSASNFNAGEGKSGSARPDLALSDNARAALWQGAGNLADHALSNNSDVKKTQLAAKLGEKVVEAALPKRGPSLSEPTNNASGTGEWVEVPEQQHHLVLQPLQPNEAESSRTAGNAVRDGRSFGPPSPSEWPQEWLQSTVEACLPSS